MPAEFDYVNITQFVKSTGKLPKDYLSTKRAAQCMQEICDDHDLQMESLVVKKKGRCASTWVHPDLADDITEWCGLFTIANGFDGSSILRSITNHFDTNTPHVYFGAPMGTWQWLKVAKTEEEFDLPSNALIIRIGQTIKGKRAVRHARSFLGFRLMDTIPTSSSALVEKHMKDFLRDDNRLLIGLHGNKVSKDKEIFYVTSQAEYKAIVAKTISIVEAYNEGKNGDEVTKAIHERENRLLQLKYESDAADAQIRIEKLNIEKAKIQRNSLIEQLGHDEVRRRQLNTFDVLEFLRVEQASKENIFRAQMFMNDIEKAFRWWTQYRYAINPTEVLGWIAKAKVPSTCRNLTIGYNALVHCERIVILMREDLGDEEVQSIHKMVDDAQRQYNKASFDKQQQKKKASDVPWDELNRLQSIENKEVVGRFAETIIKRMGWKDIQDIAENPIVALERTLKDFKDAAVSTRNKHHTALLAIVNDKVLRALGITKIGPTAFNQAVKEIKKYQEEIRKKFNEDNKDKKKASA